MPWFACEDQLRYFRPQKADKKGSRTTSTGWVSSFPLSQNAGRVKRVNSVLTVHMGLRPAKIHEMGERYANGCGAARLAKQWRSRGCLTV